MTDFTKLSPEELRIAVAKELGWQQLHLPCATDVTNATLLGRRLGVLCEWAVPNYGAPDWQAMGEMLDYAKRKGWPVRLDIESNCAAISGHAYVDTESIHRAVALASLAAAERSKK